MPNGQAAPLFSSCLLCLLLDLARLPGEDMHGPAMTQSPTSEYAAPSMSVQQHNLRQHQLLGPQLSAVALPPLLLVSAFCQAKALHHAGASRSSR